jgi:hypothetical protein
MSACKKNGPHRWHGEAQRVAPPRKRNEAATNAAEAEAAMEAPAGEIATPLRFRKRPERGV